MTPKNSPATASPSPAADRTLWWLRLVWGVVALYAFGLVLTSLPHYWSMRIPQDLATANITSAMFRQDFSQATFTVPQGVKVLTLIPCLVFFACGLFIFRKRAHDWVALIVSLLLMTMGASFTISLSHLPVTTSTWQAPAGILEAMLYTCIFIFLLAFPDGRFVPSWSRWIALAWGGYTVLWPFWPHLNPQQSASITPIIVQVMMLMCGIIAQIYRIRYHTTPQQRQQIKWVLFGFAVTTIGLLWVFGPQMFVSEATRAYLLAPPFIWLNVAIALIFPLFIPITLLFSVLRYRLWDVDILLNRTLVYGGLTLLITVVYVLLVSGLGTLAANQSGQLIGFILATGIVIVGLKPLYRQFQAIIDRFIPRPNFAKPMLDNVSEPPQPMPPSKNSLRLAQVGWVINLILSVSLFGVGYVAVFEQGISQFVQGLESLTIDAAFPNFLVNQAQITTVIAPQLFIHVTVFVLIGLFIFWQKPNDFMALLTSAMLIDIGVGMTPNILFLPFVRPSWTFIIVLWQVPFYMTGVLFLSLFPNGRFTSRWARFWAFLTLGYIALWLPFNNLSPGLAPAWWPSYLILGLFSLGILDQIIRYRHSTPVEKLRIKWVLVGFCLANVGLVLLILQPIFIDTFTFSPTERIVYNALNLSAGLASISIPIGITIALLRYDLWNIDFIINRTLVYGGITVVILSIYTVTVGGLSFFFQSTGSFGVSLIATGLIAVAFQPVREYLQRNINRLMFGQRDDPYAVLSHLSQTLQTTAIPAETLTSIVETIAATLKLPYAAIELLEQGEQIGQAATGEPIGAPLELPLRYQQETVGRLLVSPRSPDEKFTAKEQQLLADIAAQTGPVASATRLTLALQRSRERLVLAREEERRRIRRDLHDGFGPTLASQTLKLDTILDVLTADPHAAGQHVTQLKQQTQQMVADIRRLVYELRPPALDELGLLEALRSHMPQMQGLNGSLHIAIEAAPEPLPPLPAAIEVAAYRIVLEGITNVIRHAQATSCLVSFAITQAPSSPQLTITIADNGFGLPPNFQAGVGVTSMWERAEELSGTCQIGPYSVQGTQVKVVLPFSSGL